MSAPERDPLEEMVEVVTLGRAFRKMLTVDRYAYVHVGPTHVTLDDSWGTDDGLTTEELETMANLRPDPRPASEKPAVGPRGVSPRMGR